VVIRSKNHRIAYIGAVGQAERESMLERQREGIAKAKREGRYKGGRVLIVRL
jgi:DNA invertase Pin-like site-specific DNA recombinase